MSRAVSPVSGRPYGLAAVCRAWRLARSTVYRHREPPRAAAPRRPGPVGPMPDADLLEAIRAVLAASPFHGEGHRKVWARLRFAGVRTSKRRVLRLMREADLLAPSRTGAPRGPRSHDGTIVPETVDTIWGTDLTTTLTGEGQVAVFVAVDHCSAECVGVHAALRATRFEALEPLRQGVRHHFSGFGKGIAHGLALRHDHGSQYMAHDFQKELRFLGIESSPAFVRAPASAGSCRPRFATDRPRAAADGQRLRRALHPHLEGEPAVGAELRHGRGAAPGAARLPRGLQRDVADRAARLQVARCDQRRAAFSRGHGRIGSNPVSHQPRAVQAGPGAGAAVDCRHGQGRDPAAGYRSRPGCR